MYENQTKEEILERMLDTVHDSIDKREGSIVWDMLSPASIEFARGYIELDNVLRFGFAGTTYGEYLNLRCAEVGIERKPSVQATGSVTLAGPSGTFIPTIETRLSTDDELNPILFETTQEGTIDDTGQITLTARAVVGGVRGNIAPNLITLVSLGDLTTLSVVSNTAFDGGIDEESDEALLERYYQRVQKPASSGNKNHYVQWATEVTGVGSAKVFPIWSGDGTVKVVIVNSEYMPADASLVSNVQAHIDDEAPIGATVTVESATAKNIDFSVDIKVAEGKTLTEAQAEINAKIDEYLSSIAFREIVLKYTMIGSIILLCETVDDYSNLTVNSATSNIQLLETEVPVRNVVTVNEQV